MSPPMFSRTVGICLAAIGALLLASCSGGSPAPGEHPQIGSGPRTVDEISAYDLVSQTRDSLFLGYRYGMTRDEFFKHSWDLNRTGIVMNGSGAEIVQYMDAHRFRIKRTFYPIFRDELIVAMPVAYTYTGWSPWNEHLGSGPLIEDLQSTLEAERGLTFSPAKDPDGTPVMEAFKDGARITLRILDESQVRVLYEAWGEAS